MSDCFERFEKRHLRCTFTGVMIFLNTVRISVMALAHATDVTGTWYQIVNDLSVKPPKQ